MIVPRERNAVLGGTVAKSSAGALSHLSICRVKNIAETLQCLKERGYWIFGAVADPYAAPIYATNFPAACCLVIGGEGRGIRPLVQKRCDQLFTIPMARGFDSLNVSAAAAVILLDRKSTRLNSSHVQNSYAVFCLKKITMEKTLDLSTGYPINTIGRYLKNKFGCKVAKLALDGRFTCPNRDGSKGTGGCVFCSATGAGDTAGDIPSQIALLSDKWPEARYIAYFQNHTNTYAPPEHLYRLYSSALSARSDIVGLAVATRPDCLSNDVFQILEKFNKETFMWIELGLQTIHEETAQKMNRCYSLSVFDDAVSKLHARGIKTVPHLI